MIVRRNKLYLASLVEIGKNERLNPTVPNTIEIKHRVGNYETPRLIFYPSLDLAISGLGDIDLRGKIVYLYSPRPYPDKYSIHVPDPYSETPLGNSEIWLLRNTFVEEVGKVEILKRIGEERKAIFDPRPLKKVYPKWSFKNLNTQEKMEKVVYLSSSLRERLVLEGKVPVYRKIGDGIENFKEGDIVGVYKPIGQNKLSVQREKDQLYWRGSRLILGLSGKIKVEKGGQYKTL